jgi:hypothetical protein
MVVERDMIAVLYGGCSGFEMYRGFWERRRSRNERARWRKCKRSSLIPALI